jgi:hypothetical protein
MPIASLLNVDSDENFAGFAFANANHHTLVTQNINLLLPQERALTFYVLDPVPEIDLQSWLRRHQQSHSDINAALGIQGSDLTDVDFKKDDERESWSELHYSEHQQWFEATGID